MQQLSLEVISGSTYTERLQLFNRWFLPVYRLGFRWTGHALDAEDITSWVMRTEVAGADLPVAVATGDSSVAGATLSAIGRHWFERYAVYPTPTSEIAAAVARASSQPWLGFDGLIQSLDGELRRLVVVRFLRRRRIPSTAGQFGVDARSLESMLCTALSRIASDLGLPSEPIAQADTAAVATFVDDLIRRRRPLRFAASRSVWPALVAACHLQSAITGTDLPAQRFLTTQMQLSTGEPRRWRVTAPRIWSA